MESSSIRSIVVYVVGVLIFMIVIYCGSVFGSGREGVLTERTLKDLKYLH